MALKPSKITSELLARCNKFLTCNSETTVNSAVRYVSSKEPNEKPYRYKITNVRKPDTLPDLNLSDQPTYFAELQPSAKPEFRFECNEQKWAETPVPQSPFPPSIRLRCTEHNVYSDQQKAEHKMLKCKMTTFHHHSRNFSTIYSRRYSGKGPADNSGSSECKKKDKCARFKAKKQCKLGNKDCPKLKLCDCEQSKGSNCKLTYLDPHCAKKFAPYPSYSETCAENLMDDPSECQQCPWRTCDGADTIEPGKPVRNKRNYSTSCTRHLDATAGVVVAPLVPPTVEAVREHFNLKDDECNERCGVSKPACKRPLGPCEVRRQQEEARKREKEIRIPPKPKKKLEDGNRMVLEGQDQVARVPFGLESLRMALDVNNVDNSGSWIDLMEGEEMMHLNKQKHPNCHKKKKPKRKDDGDVDQDLSIEYGNVEWWKGRGKKHVVIGDGDPDDSGNCKVKSCPDTKIRSKKEITTKTWKKRDSAGDRVRNKTTPFQIRRGRK